MRKIIFNQKKNNRISIKDGAVNQMRKIAREKEREF